MSALLWIEDPFFTNYKDRSRLTAVFLYIVVCLDFATQNAYNIIVKLCMFGR